MGSSVSASSQLRIPPARGHILPRFLSLQAASGPRVFCVPQIILTECTSSSPTLPEITLEELGPQAVPTPRPRTLAGSGKTWNGPQALLGLATEVLWPRSSSVSGKEPAVLQSSHSTEARVLCLREPSPDETQKTFPVETHLEETPQNSVCDIQACSRGPRGISSGCTEQDAALLRMDSLEETLQELETTLSEMGAKSTMPCPGSPQSLHPHPQVAATPLLSPAVFLLQPLGLQSWGAGPQEHCPPPSSYCLYFSLPCSGSLRPGQGPWAEPGAAGKPAHPGLSSPAQA